MKILYISAAHETDYLCDMVFHGLRSLGEEVSDCNRLAHMYKGAPLEKMYGKGFTLFGLLDEGEVDRTDIEDKIKAKYFDLVIYGSIQRAQFLFGEVRDNYPQSQILLLDGEDNPLLFRDLMRAGVYLKRELHSAIPAALPIQFGIPEEKISSPEQNKEKLLASLDPWDPRTYIYDDEATYYRDYQRSLFGLTTKKAGWDCMRHYEIMACNCMPYFENLEGCPDTIMTKLPKEELLVAKKMFDYKGGGLFLTPSGKWFWEDLMGTVLQKLRQYMTTVALAKYVLDMAKQASGETIEMAGKVLS